MNVLMLVLRILHIVGGVFWVGSAMMSTFFLGPAVRASGDSGRAVMGYLVSKARISTRITASSVTTVLAGLALYWIDSAGLSSPWTTSGAGLGFAIGGLLALLGMGFGGLVGKNAARLGRIAATAQDKPSDSQLADMKGAQSAMDGASRLSTIALILSLLCMATARYWLF